MGYIHCVAMCIYTCFQITIEQAIKKLKTEVVNQILLQICGVSSVLEVQHISFEDMCMILNVVEEHFGQNNTVEKQSLHMAPMVDKCICKKVSILWGLSGRNGNDADGYEINIIVDYN